MEFLQLTKEHLTSVMDLEQKLFPEDAWSSVSMAAELSGNHTYYLGIFDPELIGYAGLSTSVGSFSSDIQTIGVAIEKRGQGLGRKLLHLPKARLVLVCNPSNAELLIACRAE